MVGQSVMDDQFAAHDAMRLGVAGALHTALREIDDEMAAHLVDHRLQMLFFAGLRRFFGEADILAAALQVDEPREETCERFAKNKIERGPEERLLQAAFGMQQDFENPVQKSEQHRSSSLPALSEGLEKRDQGLFIAVA
jgi:hypothetical protein